MEHITAARQRLAEWYEPDHAKELVYYCAFLLWIVATTVDTSVLAHVASLPDGRYTFLFYVVLWYCPVMVATTYALLYSLRAYVLAEARRAYHQMQASKLEILSE